MCACACPCPLLIYSVGSRKYKQLTFGIQGELDLKENWHKNEDKPKKEEDLKNEDDIKKEA